MEIQSPSLMTWGPTWAFLPSSDSASMPQTQGLPQPRATTAAWLVMPPRAVRMPSAREWVGGWVWGGGRLGG